jgi:hypothetical protein
VGEATLMLTAHAWLQKHASPTARGGEFHWHPANHALPALIERLHGAAAPCVLWELAPGRAVWAQAFAAIAPSDGRRYTGLVVTIAASASAAPAELLAAMRVPPAEPWSAPGADAGERAAEDGDDVRGQLGDGVAIASALLSGGDAELEAPADRDLPRAIAELEALMPADVRARTRLGTWRAAGNARRLPPRDPAAELLAAAWRARGRGDGARPWRATCELAAAQQRDVRELAREIMEIGHAPSGPSRVLTADERAAIGEPLVWPRVVNAWGRGRLAAPDATIRLADALAARVIGELARGGDARATIAAMRWHALLPAARRDALFAALTARAASLEEVMHA